SHIHGQHHEKPNRPTRSRPRPVRIEPLPRKAMKVSPRPNPAQMAEPRSAGQNQSGRRRRPAWTMDDSRSRRSSASRSSRKYSRMGGSLGSSSYPRCVSLVAPTPIGHVVVEMGRSVWYLMHLDAREVRWRLVGEERPGWPHVLREDPIAAVAHIPNQALAVLAAVEGLRF